MERKPKEALAPKIPTAHLLKSKLLAGYQPDFVRVLLPQPAYTAEEAKAILQRYFERGGRS